MRALRLLALWGFIFCSQWSLANDSYQAAKLRFPVECILKAVAKNKNVILRSDTPMPKIYMGSEVTLEQFQNAVELQWNLRPNGFLNVYIINNNEIYMMDEASYYSRLKRFLDDSMAHELTHYIQVMYQGFDLARGEDDSLENDAISTQNWFRQTFMIEGATASPCDL